MKDEFSERIDRLYSAIGESKAANLSRFRARFWQDDKRRFVYQDFSGGETPAQLANRFHALVALIASLEYHLRQWSSKHGRDADYVSATFRKVRSLALLHDLWNVEKHGPSTRNSYSGLSVKVTEIRRVMRLQTSGKAGSSATMTFDRHGCPVVSGDGTGLGVLTGEILDAKDGHRIAEGSDVLSDAISTLETLMRSFGIVLPRR